MLVPRQLTHIHLPQVVVTVGRRYTNLSVLIQAHTRISESPSHSKLRYLSPTTGRTPQTVTAGSALLLLSLSYYMISIYTHYGLPNLSDGKIDWAPRKKNFLIPISAGNRQATGDGGTGTVIPLPPPP